MKNIFSLALLLFSFQLSMAQTTIDRTKQPKPGPPPVISIKDPAIFKLKNGVTVLVVENHKLPKVDASLMIDKGPSYEGQKAGVSSIMGSMLNEGTKTMSKEIYDQKIDLMGASVSLSSRGGGVSALTRYFEPSFKLFADGLKNPALLESSFEKLKTQTLAGLKAQEKSAEAIASRMVRALNFGKNTAMGEFETQESVESLTLGDIKEAYNNFITPSRAYLIFSGDITLAEAKKIANEYLGDWKGKTLTFPTIAPEKSIAKTEVDIIDLPSAVQAQLFVTNLITNPMTNPDYFALTLTNQILGGGSEGKLFQNLREKRGFTYGSYSSIGSGRFQSLVSSSAQVRTEKVDSAVAEIMAELKNMQNGNFTQKDLDLVKAKYNGSFALNMENPELAASYALNILTNNLPKDFYRTFLQKINAVTLADIKRVSQKYLSTDKARIIIVGNAEQITPGLKKLGYNIKNFDAYGNPVKASAPVATDASMTAEKVIDKYLKAVGGKDALQKINTYSATVSMDMGGQKLSGSMKKMAPYSTSMELTMNGMSAFKMMFDGTSGYQAQMGQKSPFGEEEIKIQKDEKGIFPQLHYGEASYKVSLEGSSKVNGEDAYKVKVIKPSGNVSHEFYSIKTGYLLKQTSTLKAQGQEMEQTVEFGDYKDIGGIMTPTSITQLAGGQELPMKLSDIKYNSGVTAEDFK